MHTSESYSSSLLPVCTFWSWSLSWRLLDGGEIRGCNKRINHQIIKSLPMNCAGRRWIFFHSPWNGATTTFVEADRMFWNMETKKAAAVVSQAKQQQKLWAYIWMLKIYFFSSDIYLDLNWNYHFEAELHLLGNCQGMYHYIESTCGMGCGAQPCPGKSTRVWSNSGSARPRGSARLSSLIPPLLLPLILISHCAVCR